MKFDVKFGGSAGIIGSGSIYMDETGIVIEGHFQRFWLPVGHQVLKQIICEWSLRTIPFGKIVTYSKPSIWNRRWHQVTYLLPDRKKKEILFKMKRRRRGNDAEFVTRFREYYIAMKSFSES